MMPRGCEGRAAAYRDKLVPVDAGGYVRVS